ncbi:MAG: hypothetical protein ABIQ59_00300 [Nocardioidaceae bacterium]
MSVLIAVLVGLLVAVAFLAFGLVGRGLPSRVTALVCVCVLGVLAFAVVLTGDLTGPDTLLGRLLVVELALAAVLAGSPVTATVLWLVDRGSSRTDSMERAGEVLRGGAWIGAFERAAVFAALASGWPEGLAVVLALKGLGRYSELRGTPGEPSSAGASGGVAERFIIGTFASVLWSCACAGTYLSLVG